MNVPASPIPRRGTTTMRGKNNQISDFETFQELFNSPCVTPKGSRRLVDASVHHVLSPATVSSLLSSPISFGGTFDDRRYDIDNGDDDGQFTLASYNIDLTYKNNDSIISTSVEHVRTPPLKKRRLVVGSEGDHSPAQRSPSFKKRKINRTETNKRVSLTIPNLLMELKYPELVKSKDTYDSKTIVPENQICPTKNKFLTKYTLDCFPLPSLKKAGRNDADDHRRKEDVCTAKNKTERKTKDTMVSSCVYDQATYNNNNIIGRKAPTLDVFRKKWDAISKKKAHISEHRMSDAEKSQILRESFGKIISRRI